LKAVARASGSLPCKVLILGWPLGLGREDILDLNISSVLVIFIKDIVCGIVANLEIDLLFATIHH
jgi:hypothetical protein